MGDDGAHTERSAEVDAPGEAAHSASARFVPPNGNHCVRIPRYTRRSMAPSQPAGLIAFLASDEADGITGTVVPIDWGITC